MQTPAPPLANDASRQVAHGADTVPRKVAGNRRERRRQAVPEQPSLAPDLRAVLTPVAAARRNGDDAAQPFMAVDERQDLRANAMSDPVDWQLGSGFHHGREHRAAVVAGPVEDVDLQLTQRYLAGAAHAQIIEGDNKIALVDEPAGKSGVETLFDTHRRGDQHRTTGRAVWLIPVAGNRVAIAVVDRALFCLYRRHLVVLPLLGLPRAMQYTNSRI